MWKFLIESYRNKKNRPLSFFVNWIGMTLGLAAVVVIYLYVMQEVRHDKGVYAASMENVYRVGTTNEEMGGAIVPSGLRAAVEKMPEVESAVRVMNYEQVVSTQGLSTEKIMRLKLIAADTTLFSVLPFKISSGTQTPFSLPNEAVVSREAAIRLFDTEDVIGKTIKINNQVPVQIVAVIKDVPENSIFSPDVIIPMRVLAEIWNSDYNWFENAWGHWNFETYVKIKDNTDPLAFEGKVSDLVKSKILENWGHPFEGEVYITPFQEIYFQYDDGYSQAKTVDKNPIILMAFIALLVLIVAIVNYVNIYTARSTEIIRAMGVKSIMGAKRTQLIAFVIFDSVVITLVSAISAFLLAWSLEPFYFDIIGSKVSFHLTWDMVFALFVGIPIICGVISGIFPAIVLTKMKPLDAIANRSSGNKTMGFVRNGLIVLQFTIAIVLIGSTLFINKQMKYISDMDLGYYRENIVTINGSNFIMKRYDAFRNKLNANKNIVNVALVKNSPIYVGEFSTLHWGETIEEQVTANLFYGDENALDLFGIDILEGQPITDVQGKTDTIRRYLINETMAKMIRQQIPDVTFPFKQYAGVIKNFHHTTATNVAGPLAFASVYRGGYADVYIKINGQNLDETIDFIAKTFAEIYQDNLYEFDFLDQQFANIYRNEQLFRSRLLTFSILTIFISCLGLFALVSYSVQRRKKEIAIRKVYGSTVGQVLGMLTVSFLKWLFVSFVIAAPIIYYVSTSWVETYQFKTELSWWIFAVAFFAAMVVAMFTVVGESYRAATENPADAVKKQ